MSVRWFEGLGEVGLRWPRAVLALVAIATLWGALALRDFHIEPDISRMLPRARAVGLFRDLEQRTRGGKSLLVVVHGEERERLEVDLRAVAARLRASPHVAQVRATRAEWLGDTADSAPLWELSAEARAELAQRLTNGRRAALDATLQDLAADPLGGADLARADPLGVRNLLGEAAAAALPVPLAPGTDLFVLADGKVGALLVTGQKEPYDVDFARALLADVEVRLAGVRCDLWGGYVVAREQASRMQSDMIWSSTCSSLLIGLYLALALRSLLAPLLVLLPTALAILWALPLGAWLHGPFNVIAVGAAAVLLGLGDDFSMHFFARYGAERATRDHAGATRATLREVGVPIALGALTTCVAFLSLAFGEFEGLAGFGVLLTLGVAIAVLLTFTLAPALLGWPRVARLVRVAPPRSAVVALLERVAGSRAGLPVALALIALGASGLGAALVHGVRFDVDADALSPRTSAADAQRERVEAAVGFAPIPMAVLLDADTPPERVHDGVAELRARGVIRFADGPLRALPPQAVRADVAAFRQATAGFVAATLADLRDLECDAAAFEPALAGLAAMLARDPPAIAERYRVRDGDRERLAVYCYVPRAVRSEAAWREFDAAARAAFGAGAEPFGSFALMGEIRRVLGHDLLVCSLVTLGLVLLVAVGMTRGHWLGWLAVLPVLVGSGITLGLLVVFDVPLNLANFVAIPFLLGIGIDDGIHLASHYRDADRARPPGPVGVAIWRTTITTALAFGSLMATSSRGLQAFGLIALVGVVACLLASLLVMVPLVRWLAARGWR